MKIVTGPIDGFTVLTRALLVANTPGAELDWSQLHLLPPGAPYRIDQQGRVYAAPRRKRARDAATQECRRAIRALLEGTYRDQTRVRNFTDEVKKPLADGSIGWRMEPHRFIGIDFPLGPFWGAQSVVNGELVMDDSSLVVPTLDALVQATSAVLLNPEVRSLVRTCPICKKYFLRQRGRKQATCGRQWCHDENQRAVRRAAAKKRPRSAVRGAGTVG